jgi:hypothetical protein
MPVPKPKNELREVGRVSADHWERFDRSQRNLRPFLCRKPKRPPIERFRSYVDLESLKGKSVANKSNFIPAYMRSLAIVLPDFLAFSVG